jgi:hypothetical protein
VVILKDQKPDRQYLLNKFLSQTAESAERNSPHLDEGEGLMDDDDSSDNSDFANNSHIRPAFDTEYTYLQSLKNFLIKSDLFFRFQSVFLYFLRPFNSLLNVFRSYNIHMLERYVTRNFNNVAISEFE